MQLHLKDKSRPETASDEDVEPPAQEDYQIKSKTNSENKNKKTHSQSLDSEEGASNEGSQARYVYPPDGFLNNIRQNNINNNNAQYLSDSHSTYGSTPTPKDSYNSSPSGSEQQSSLNVHYVASSASPHFSATQTPRVQYVSNPSNYQDASASQLNYVSTPDPSNSYDSNSYRVSNFGSNSQQPQSYSNHIQYVSTPSPRSPGLQNQFSTPAPSIQFAAQISQNHPASSNINYVSSPAPNTVYLSTPQSRNQYVSSPVQYVSTPSPVQYSSSSSSYGTHLSSNRDQGLYQMQIDHFNNAMSGVRNPKYASQISESVFVSSTPEPVVISTAVLPKQHQNEQNWRTGTIPNALFKEQSENYNFNGKHNQQPQHLQQYVQSPFSQSNQKHSQQYQSMKDTESQNNLVLVNTFQQSQEKNHKTFQRDVDTETEVAQLYSNGDFGWKVSPKKPPPSQNNIGEYTEQRQVIYSPSPVPNHYPTQTSTPHSESNAEYRPYPNNPFLNHIAIQTAPQVNSGAVQSINFQPDHNQQQNINVGYSIGFGNQLASNQETPKAAINNNEQRERDISNYQPFTTASSRPTVQSDIIKGVKVSQVNSPDQSLFLRDSQNRYEKPQSNRESFESTGKQIQYFDRAVSEYQKSPQFKEDNSRNNEEKVQTQFFGSSAKLFNFDSPKFSENFNRNDGKTETYKWSNYGAGVEVSTLSSPSSPKTSVQLTPEMTSNYPVVYVNNPNNVVTNTPFYFSTPKEVNDARYLQTFDHEKAIKNIQPIGLSNVVPHTSLPSSNNDRSFPTQYSNYPQQIQQQSYTFHQNSVPTSQQDSNYQQEQYQISPSPLSYQNVFYQGSPSNLYSNSKPVEQAYYKEKEVIFSTQQPHPKNYDNSRNNEIRSYIFGNPNEQTSFDSSNYNQNTGLQSVPQNFIGPHSSDMIAYSSNVQPLQTAHIDYVPSETFRSASQESKPSKNRQSIQENENKLHQAPSNGQIMKYTHVSDSPSSEFQQSNDVFTNTGFDKEYNKNNGGSKSSPEQSARDKYQSVSSNNRQLRQNKGESTYYDNINDIFPNGPPSKLTTINGLKVANPYNMDLQVVSDILSGKIAVDETLLHTVREQVARLNPIKVDTKALQDQVSKNEEISVQIDLPNHEVHDSKDIQERSNFKSDRSIESPKKKSEEKKNKNRIEELAYTQSSRPFSSFYERNDHELQYPISSSIVSEHLTNSGQSILNQHEIGSVIDQEVYPSGKARSNGGLTIPEIEDFGAFDSYKNIDLENKPNYYQRSNLLSDEILQKRAKADREPYTLLVPPRPPGSMRGVVHRKSEFPIRLRTHKLSQRRSRPSKQVMIFDEPAETDSYEHSFNIKTELRPPPKRL